jgi:hypothetical protein
VARARQQESHIQHCAAGEKLKNLDMFWYETAGEIGRPRFIKTQPEKEIEDRMKMMDSYDLVMVREYQNMKEKV